MMIVGLTGGIGSGKTTVANIFSELGVPVYVADDEAKALMNRSKVIRRKLKTLFGEAAYKGKLLNKPFIADKIFSDVSMLKKMNAIVHPKVKAHFKRWLKKQKSAYVIKEVAILFETGGYEECDLIVIVTAPKEERIKRLLKRDKTTKAKVEAIMKNQWEDSKKQALSDFIIENSEPLETRKQVIKIHKEILAKTQ